MPVASRVHVRALTDFDDLDACVEVQRRIWGDAAEVDGRALLVVASRFAGQLLAAFDGERMVGMALAFHMATPARMHSHRVGVIEEYRAQGIGRSLKLAQRTAALAGGVRTIEWTFDPLQAGNAAFNLTALGAIARTYLPNLYGITSSPLHAGLPTDRLLVEWELDSARVARALSGARQEPGPASIRIALPPPERRTQADGQKELREQLRPRLAEGMAIIGLVSEAGKDFYILEGA